MNEGIYDQLITRGIKRSLDALNPNSLKIMQLALEEADTPEYLSRHLARQIKIALQSLPREERKRKQIQLANELLSIATNNDFEAREESIHLPGEILRAIYTPPAAPDFPEFPLATSSLIMNVKDEPRLGSELQRELRTADSVLMLVSFIQWRGWKRLESHFQHLTQLGKPVRVLTTTYMGASDLNALKALISLPNVELKICLNKSVKRLHAKAWLFERSNGFSTAYVGSANLSKPALEDGIEWTVKLSEIESPQIINKFRGAFETLWADDEFQSFNLGDIEFELRVDHALRTARGSTDSSLLPALFFDLKPHDYQQATLDQLAAERIDRNHWRNLVVAPTGTGKTFLAAFDYKRQGTPGSHHPTLLFLAHREELLLQAKDAFRHVLRDENFGELLAGGAQVTRYDHIFATVQSFQSRQLWKSVKPDHWSFIVLDEAHHTTAQSYQEAVEILKPQIMLGLTATPERMDGKSILPWFDNRIADEMRLWHAIERQYLAPFEYYGIHDGTDLASVTWSRGSYSISELSVLYNSNRRRAELIVKEFTTIYGDYRKARALGFCVSIEHAQFMATVFNRFENITAEAVTSNTPDEQRKGAIARLRKGEVNVLFTVDLFNEGVDIPELDCLLFLRPTESSTVFLQQLGRGLRLSEGKLNCLVLDFIGNQRKEFRFDLRLRALFGGTRRQTLDQLRSGVTALPGNCYFHLDRESRKSILERLQTQLAYSHARVVEELRRTRDSLGHTPSLTEFLHESQFELDDVYRYGSSWASLLTEAGLIDTPLTASDEEFAAQFQHLLHIDSVSRLRGYQCAVRGETSLVDRKSALQLRSALMLTLRLFQAKAREARDEWSAIDKIQSCEALKEDFLQLCDALLDRIPTHSDEAPFVPEQPLYLHRSYMRDEILAAVGWKTLRSSAQMREGVLWLKDSNTELFFVTLDKSEKHFSPTTRYEDYAISPTRFHWQSQSRTSDTSATGRRYQEQQINGSMFLLFVRANNREPYMFLGPLTYISHKGSRPMSIEWQLQHRMPAWFFEICASLRAA